MTHPLANDPTVPAILRRAFARVREQIVRIYDDGSESIINMTAESDIEGEAAEHRKRIGKTFASGRKLVAVEVRAV